MVNPTPDDISASETRVAAVAAAAAAAAVAAAAPSTPAPDRRAQWLSALAFGLVALLGVLIVLYAWRLPPFSSAIVATENALVRGQVTLIGTQLPGYVVDVRVQDFQHVKRGDFAGANR